MNILLVKDKKTSVRMTDAILHGMGLLTKDSISSIKIGGVLQLDLFGEDNLLCGRVVYARQGYGLMRI